MKVCRFVPEGDALRRGRLGLLLEDEGVVVDCNMVRALDFQREGRYDPFGRADRALPSSLHEVLSLADDPLGALEESLGLYLFLRKVGDLETREGAPVAHPVDRATLLCPLDRITSYRDFYTHEKHVAASFKRRGEEIPSAWYEIPAYYKGAVSGFVGPGDELVWPSYTDRLDYELELALVVGRDGRDIRPRDARGHVFGFTILNDVSARDVQRKEMAVRLGPAKGKDFCSVLGPVIATIDEFEWEPDLLMRARVNGEQWSEGRSGDARYSWARVLEHLSRDEWVRPGDVLASGTVGTGCGMELDRWVRPGDEVELEVEGVGVLANRVGRKRGEL